MTPPSRYDRDWVFGRARPNTDSPYEWGGKLSYGHAPAAWLSTVVSAQAEQALL
jgi:hypothetical protein